MTTILSREEVAEFNRTMPDKCFVVLDGDVLEVSRFVQDHPGGPDVFAVRRSPPPQNSEGSDTAQPAHLSLDISAAFKQQGHSPQAKLLARQFAIGRLTDAAAATAAAGPPPDKDTDSPGASSAAEWEREKAEIIRRVRSSWWGWRVSVVPYVASALVGVATYVAVARWRSSRRGV